jgi:hypothetical protein
MRRTIYTLLLAVALVATGCSSKKSGSNGNPYNPGGGGVPPVTDPVGGDPTTTGGATVDLVISKVALDEYLGWTTNVPTDAKVVINLTKQGTYTKTGGGYDYGFGGYVSVKFKDSGSSYIDQFSSMHLGGYGTTNTVKNNTENHKYNLLSSDYPGMNGAVGYHGFFEDSRVRRLMPPLYGQPLFGGAVILVIDSTNDLGDGSGPTTANGSIWFKNYVGQYPQGPLPSTNCWFISAGPYDCRSWKSGDGVATKRAMLPDNGYIKLGSFTGLEIKKAFNDQI